jgi:fructokinase
MKYKLVGLGEVLWDLLPDGKQLGGAPANFTCHARALGAEARLVSRVGSDASGREIIERLERLGVPAECVQIDSELPTGRVTIEVAGDGQPRFTIHENVAWDRLAADDNARRAVASADAVCFGTLAQRTGVSRASIQTLVRLARGEALRVFDVNLRQHFYTREIIEESLAMANVLKVNDAELPQVAALFGIDGDARIQLSTLAKRFQLRAAACTRGANGALLLVDGHCSDHPGIQVQVKDAVGAGDSFTAAMVLGLLAEWNPDRINEQANRIAAHVASCTGATPPIPDELRAPFLDISGERPNR